MKDWESRVDDFYDRKVNIFCVLLKTQTLIIDEIPFCNCNERELTEAKTFYLSFFKVTFKRPQKDLGRINSPYFLLEIST